MGKRKIKKFNKISKKYVAEKEINR